MIRILFVDDEPNILHGLRRTLRSRIGEWDMVFAEGASAALAELASRPFDVVASDLHMQGMDGAALLGEVKNRWPGMLRVILSGSQELSRVIRTVHEAHQYLAKPCDPALLQQVIDRAMQLRALLREPGLARFVSGVTNLPSLPQAYQKIDEALRDETRSVRDIGDLITQDVALTAKVLQIVNSAFFALPRQVASPGEGAVVLGLDVLRSLVLGTDLFSKMDPQLAADGGMGEVWQHSLDVACAARTLGTLLGCDKRTTDTAFQAGILHEIGRVIMLVMRPHEYLLVRRERASDREQLDLEESRFGTTHELVGAYLLASWGLCEEVVTSVAFHRRPAERAAPKIGLS